MGNTYGPPARPEETTYLRLDLYRGTVMEEDCLVAELRRPGLPGSMRRTWPLTGGRLTESQLQDLGTWTEMTIRGAVFAKLHFSGPSLRP